MTIDAIERKLQEQLLLGRRVAGDHLMLSDAVIGAALDGSRALTEAECAAMRSSPLTLRRFRALALARRAATSLQWPGSGGMLRAASSTAALTDLATDDGHWRLHFVPQGESWRVILALDAGAPFAAQLLREQQLLRVVDGQGAVILQGSLDNDGECEAAWPFASEPAAHLQQAGANFAVEPAR